MWKRKHRPRSDCKLFCEELFLDIAKKNEINWKQFDNYSRSLSKVGRWMPRISRVVPSPREYFLIVLHFSIICEPANLRISIRGSLSKVFPSFLVCVWAWNFMRAKGWKKLFSFLACNYTLNVFPFFLLSLVISNGKIDKTIRRRFFTSFFLSFTRNRKTITHLQLISTGSLKEILLFRCFDNCELTRKTLINFYR